MQIDKHSLAAHSNAEFPRQKSNLKEKSLKLSDDKDLQG